MAIKERSIDDCLSWAFEYLYLCKSSKEMVILKLDFKKAFDRIDHEVVPKVMQYKGFDQKWNMWMKMIIESGTSAILLNGVPRKVFHYRRGVRQGDPPLLCYLYWLLIYSRA
jgi:hypothetical protein